MHHHYRRHTPERYYFGLIFVLCIGVIISFAAAYYIKREQRKKKYLNKHSHVLISGGSKGVGSQLATLFAKTYKCNVIILDNEESQPTCNN